MTENTNDTSFDFEDFDFDGVPDAPSYRTFPPGAHKVTLTAAVKTDKTDASKKWVQVSLKYIAPVEVDPSLAEEDLPKVDDVSTVRYYIFGGKDGGVFMRGQLKKVQAPIGKAIGSQDFKAFLAATAEGLVGTVVVKEKDNTFRDKTTKQQEIENFILD